jgi:hypothetical protein
MTHAFISSLAEIPVIAGPIDPATMVKKYIRRRHPVIVRNGVKALDGLAKWTPDYLADAIGNLPLTVLVSNDGFFPRNEKGKSIGGVTMPASQFHHGIFKTWTPGKNQFHYVKALPILRIAPHLAPEMDISRYVAPFRVSKPDVWWGTGGTRSFFHYDLGHNVSIQLAGRKEWIVADPWQYDYCYAPFIKDQSFYSAIDIDNPDFVKFPRFRKARLIKFVVEAGDFFYLPSCWWHRVVAFEPSISIRYFLRPRLKDVFAPAIYKNAHKLLLPWLKTLRPAQLLKPVQ